MNGDFIFYQFSRPAILEGDFSDFLSRFGESKLPKGKALAEMMNNMLPFVQGYDHDPREIYAIPEVRKFYSALNDVWPYWLFFGNLDTDALRTVYLCCMKSLDSLAMKGNPLVQVAFDPLEVLTFITKQLGPMNKLCDRSGMNDRQIAARTHEIFQYFGLPC
jgi:hypothetical protein